MLWQNFWFKLKPSFRSITEVITQIQNVLQEISPCLYVTNYQLSACCQLMQSVLKMDCALSERWVKTRWTDFKHEMTYKWWLSWLAVKSPWLAGHFSVCFFFFVCVDMENSPLTLWGLNFRHCRQCSVKMSINWWESPDLLMSGYNQGCKHAPND